MNKLRELDAATAALVAHVRECPDCRKVLDADGHPENTCADYARRWELWRAALAATARR